MKFLIFFLGTKAKLKPVGLVKSCIGEVGQELNRYSQLLEDTHQLISAGLFKYIVTSWHHWPERMI
jgi:hypothetical protein